MDLSFTPEEAAFAGTVREWLRANVEVPARFEAVNEAGDIGAVHDELAA